MKKNLNLFINFNITDMATTKKIWQIYVFGKLDSNGNIVYFTPKNNRLEYKTVRRGKTYTVTIADPTEADMNTAGWYRVVNVAEDGTDYIADNILYHYTGSPSVEEPIEDDEEN